MNSPRTTADLTEIRLNDAGAGARWDELVGRCPQSDVYHRAAYILATADVEHSQPLGLIVSFNRQQYLLPMLVRPIPGPDGQTWFDASTPYGYGGVICLDCGPTSTIATDLFHCLREWCATRNLVSCVLRSHPLLAQDWLFAQGTDVDSVSVTRRGQTTAMPLQHWDETRQCPAEMSKGRRSDLALARRHLRVAWNTVSDQTNALEQFRIFRALYESTMRRVDATEFFHFPWSYYERLSTLGPDVGVAIAWYGDRAVGGAVFMAGPTYAHYHLSASDETGYKYKASTLLVVEGANWARQRACRSLHLGGGMLVNDSLMAFKQSFGGEPHQFGHVMLIADRGRYDSMCSLAAPPWPYDQKMTSQITHAEANAPLRVILMGKDKPVVRKGFDYLLSHGYSVVAVVGPENGPATGGRLVDVAARRGIPTTTDKKLYDVLEGRAAPETLSFSLDNIDLVVSLLFWKRIRKPLIQLPRIGCINFHPAPLPEFRGIGGYNVAILENLNYWGAAVHFVDEAFDTGELIDVRLFDIDASRETAFSLEQKTQHLLFEMFRDTMENVKRDLKFTGKPQGEGRYFSKDDFEQLRRIQPDDSPETIARKVRAFWYPPNGGASILINGTEYTVIDQEILARIVKRSD
jgi:methionyl-tRNA formyltransferase